jgi:hypothetical protein
LSFGDLLDGAVDDLEGCLFIDVVGEKSTTPENTPTQAVSSGVGRT